MAGGGRGRREEAEAADHDGDGWLAASRGRREEVAGRRPQPAGRMGARWPTALGIGEEEEEQATGERI